MKNLLNRIKEIIIVIKYMYNLFANDETGELSSAYIYKYYKFIRFKKYKDQQQMELYFYTYEQCKFLKDYLPLLDKRISLVYEQIPNGKIYKAKMIIMKNVSREELLANIIIEQLRGGQQHVMKMTRSLAKKKFINESKCIA